MFLRDLRFALRGFLREPRFSIAALLTLALGIGANVAVFAVFEAVMLRPLPYDHAEELVILNHRSRETGITKEFIALGDFVDLAAQQSRMSPLVPYGSSQATLYEPDGPTRLSLLNAGPGLFETLRIAPVLGRALTGEDGVEGAADVGLLGYSFWQSHYGGDPAMVGRSIQVGNSQVQIVGIAPPGFGFPPGDQVDLVVNSTTPTSAPAQRASGWTFAMARLKPDVTPETATSDLAVISRRMEQEYPASNTGSEYFVLPLRDAVVGSTKGAFPLLLAGVAVVLLIACANVANLLLVRALGRQREFAVRQALGASKGRLLSQMLAESLVLALAGALVGTAVAHGGAKALAHLIPNAETLPGLSSVGVNGLVLAFALGIAILTAVLSSIQSVLTLGSKSFSAAMVASRGTSRGVGARRATATLVVAEIALGIILLLGAGLILRSFRELIRVNPGFDRSDVLTMSVSIPAERYNNPEAARGFVQQAELRLKALPGIEQVGEGVVIPLTGNNWTVPFDRADRPVPEGQRPPDVGWQNASGGYFSTLRIPLIAGRLFDETDATGGKPVVIISQSVQRQFFNDSSAVGRMVTLGANRLEIVGVVGDIHRASLRDDPRADMYFAAEQGTGNQFNLFVRTDGDPARAFPAITAGLRELEPNVVVTNPQTMEEIAREDTQVTELLLWLLGIFALVALGLAAVGLYGIMSYAVRLRTREIGTRVALGASRSAMVGMVMRQGIRLALIGVAIGFAGGLAAVRLLRSVVYGVGLADPMTLVAASLTMLGTAALACYLPARRAAMVDPARTLTEE